ncbi:hypothetical protein VPH35_050828 [Triticum aestivum]
MEMMHKATESAYDEDNGKGKDVTSTEENDPWNPPYPPGVPAPAKDVTEHIKLIKQKIFLDTVRLIAERTDDLLAEVRKYIKDGKLAETAVLLLAAQKKIRAGSSFKENGNSKTDGFSIISHVCTEDAVAIDSQITQNRVRKKQQLKADKKLRRMALLLVIVICEAGEALDAYIRAHPEVPYAMQVAHDEVLKRVSSILNNHGFCPTGECINIENLCPYDQQSSSLSDNMLSNKHDGYATAEMVARKKQPRGWELEHARRSFVPYWKAVLFSQLEARACSSPMIESKAIREMDEILNKAAEEGSSPIPHSNLGLSGRISRLTSNHRSRRLFGTAASTVLKLLKHA